MTHDERAATAADHQQTAELLLKRLKHQYGGMPSQVSGFDPLPAMAAAHAALALYWQGTLR